MANRDQNAFFHELYDATHEKVLAYIIVKCGNTEDISDIFQETYMEIVSVIRKHGIAYMKNPEAFVMQIAKRKIYRHYKLLERLRATMGWSDLAEDYSENSNMEKVSFEEGIMNQVTIDLAMQYLGQQEEQIKKIFYLHYYMDKTIKEVSELLLINESTVKSKLYRTLKGIRKYLLEEDGVI